ncbi:hypothetical protein [Flagellimonas sp. W118]|uniref:hypothetical protein n=1 Tax=Flagellimonas sp. W118 TaxID=3410791 RepID=UPI003BF46613
MILKLKNDKRKYKLGKNIEQSRYNKKYELVKNELKKSGKAIIWIKKTDISEMEPQVFQIATGERNILYDMEDVKSELKFLFPLMLILGFFGIGVYLNHKYPDNVNRIFGKKPVANNV